MGRKYQVISADGHVEVPGDMWLHHVSSKYKDKMPKLVRHDDGSEWWHMMEFERDNTGNLVCFNDYDTFLPSTGRTYHNPDGSSRPGCSTSSQRLREQDMDGIDAEVLYPPVYLGPFFRPMIERDRNAYLEIIRAYNTFLAQDYCAVAPDRLIGNAMVPETNVDDAIKEMERCRKMGLKAISLSQWPNGGSVYKPEDDKYFAAVIDLDMKLSPHVGFGGNPPAGDPMKGPQAIMTVNRGAVGGAPPAIAQAIINGLFDKFPKLQFYFAETQAGWIPHYLDFVDEFYQRWYPYWDVKLKQLPSDYIRDRCRFSFISDRLAMKYRHYIGLDLLMWGSDFPHSVGTAPHSRDFLAEYMADVPEAEVRKVLVENPCKFFDLDMTKDLTPTPA